MKETRIATEHKGILAWFAHNHIASNLLMVFLLLSGIITMLSTTVEIFPEVDPRTITINVPYPGSNPDEVEEIINRRIEEAITGIEGIEKIRSAAAEGAGTVTAELEDDANDRTVLDDIKSAVEQIQNFPPEDADAPEIKDTSTISSVITIAIYGQASERSLHELAYRIRDEITALDGISIANVRGIRDYEIGVEVSEHALREHRIRFEDVAAAVRNFSVKLSGGTIHSKNQEILLRADGQAYNSEDFESIILRTNTDGTILRLGDIGQAVDGFEDIDQTNLFNGQPAAFISVSRVGNQQVLEIEETVKEYVKNLPLPQGIQSTIWSNRAENLRDRIDLLVRNGLMGLVLVFGVLVLFLNLRLAFWTTMGIPISFLGAFLLIHMAGATINMITLFAFILVLGIVVDDAIIVGENIYAKREQGRTPLAAAVEGLHDVITPVSVGILTTILAFVPLLFTSGFLGKILWVIPIVVISVLMMSLIEASLILPAHLSNVRMTQSTGALPWVQEKFRSLLLRGIDRFYTPALKLTMKQPYVVVAIAASILMLAVGSIAGGHLKSIYFPHIEGDNIAAKLRMPSGTPTSETEVIIKHMLDAAEQTRREYDERMPPDSPPIIRNISATVGSTPFSGRGGPGAQGDSSKGTHLGEVKIELLRGELRPFKASTIESDWRNRVGDIPGAEITFNSNILSAGDDINVELAHADFDQLLIAADRLKTAMGDSPGVVEITDSFEIGKPELRLALKDTGIAAGLTLNDLARQVRQAFYGAEAQRVQRGRDDLRVLVRYSESERRSLETLYRMRIRLSNGDEVPFHTVASVSESRGYATINRADRRRVVNISAKVDDETGNANEINAFLRDHVLSKLQRDMPGLYFSFEGAEKERMDSLKSLAKALVVALIAIFAVLAIQLGSYTQPLIIMSVIPLGFVGAAIGHWVLGYPISFFSMFGLVALSGVVVNDSLILMDMINRLRKNGLSVRSAVLAAGQRRFRPIFFTTLTTCVGLAPIISEKSLQAQFLIPMAISLAFGVAFATLITLFVVPALYIIRSQIGGYLHQFSHGHITSEELL